MRWSHRRRQWQLTGSSFFWIPVTFTILINIGNLNYGITKNKASEEHSGLLFFHLTVCIEIIYIVVLDHKSQRGCNY